MSVRIDLGVDGIIQQAWDVQTKMSNGEIAYSMTKELLLMRLLTAECVLELQLRNEGNNTVM